MDKSRESCMACVCRGLEFMKELRTDSLGGGSHGRALSRSRGSESVRLEAGRQLGDSTSALG